MSIVICPHCGRKIHSKAKTYTYCSSCKKSVRIAGHRSTDFRKLKPALTRAYKLGYDAGYKEGFETGYKKNRQDYQGLLLAEQIPVKQTRQAKKQDDFARAMKMLYPEI